MPKQKSNPEGVNRAVETSAGQLPAADQDFWRRTEAYMPRTKQGVFVRLDADVIAWLKAKGKGYQTRMNAMLRVLMESDQTDPRLLGGNSALGLPILLDTGAVVPVLEIDKPTRRRRPRVA
jgi:uncharacterized protein (DUF4415 family)